MISKYTLRASVVVIIFTLMPSMALAQDTTTTPEIQQQGYGGVAVALNNYDVPDPPGDIVEAQTAERRGTGFHVYLGLMLSDTLGVEAFFTDFGDYEWEGEDTGLTTARISPTTTGVAVRMRGDETPNGLVGFFRIGAHSYSATLQPTPDLFAPDCGGHHPTCPAQDESGSGLIVGFGSEYENFVYGLDYYTGLDILTLYAGVQF